MILYDQPSPTTCWIIPSIGKGHRREIAHPEVQALREEGYREYKIVGFSTDHQSSQDLAVFAQERPDIAECTRALSEIFGEGAWPTFRLYAVNGDMLLP